MSLRVAHTTVAAESIARTVEQSYAVGPIAFCCLISRGYNDVYELRGEDGRKSVARLAALRFRGPSNIAYETAFLAHLKQAGLPVAAAIPAADGALWRALDTAEGPRILTLFEHLAGTSPMLGLATRGKLGETTLADIELMGAGHARIHAAGETYAGPGSLYRLEAEHLLHRPLSQILAAPTMDDELRTAYVEIVEGLASQLAKIAPCLSQAACHGDSHGGNTFMSDGADGARIAGWFDFDDGGPGFLAYDLAVFLWSMLRFARSAKLGEISTSLWGAMLKGYRSVRPIPAADFEAIGLFVSIRNILFNGEYASRIPEWGMQTVSRDWLAGEVAMLRNWDQLVTPGDSH